MKDRRLFIAGLLFLALGSELLPTRQAFGQVNGQTFRDSSGIILNKEAVEQQLARGRKKAERKLQKHDGCRDLFVALGSNGLSELDETTYHWVTSQEERRLCAKINAAAFTWVNATRTCLCPDFTRLDSYQLAVALIHEALHHAGLPEMPPDPLAMTSAEINTLVKRHCRL